MTETATSIKALLQPYADSDDPRFEALQCRFHPRVLDTRHEGYWCPDCDEHWWGGQPPDGVRTDIGALVDVAAACELLIHLFPPKPGQSGWRAAVNHRQLQRDVHPGGAGSGDTARDALAQAIVDAVPLTPNA